MAIKILINATLNQQKQWLLKPTNTKEVTIIFFNNEVFEADLYIDNIYTNYETPFASIQKKPVLVNAVELNCDLLPNNFFTFNGWETHITTNALECNYSCSEYVNQLKLVTSILNWPLYLFKNVIGMASARTIAMIINEAYFALESQVSTKNDIDIAMKLGTNYPYGPFEWGQKIGLQNIFLLLNQLSLQNKKFEPCNLLKEEANF